MLRKLIHFTGDFIIILGGCMCLPLLIALAYGEKPEVRAFLICIVSCICAGLLINIVFRRKLSEESINRRDSYLIVTFSWILASVIGAVPYLLSGTIDSFYHAFFETCSGFTTTGASVFTDVESLPHSILIWRTFTQWLGGMGIIVLFVALLPGLSSKISSISNAETPGPMKSKVAARTSDSARSFYIAYILLTACLFVLLLFSKMSSFDALAHAFATMATGGLSTHNAGLAYFDSGYIYLIIGIFTFIAGTNFVLFFNFISGRVDKIVKDEEYNTYLAIILFSTIAIAACLIINGSYSSAPKSFLRALFQTVNTLSTTGYLTADSGWPPFCVLLLVFLMIVGGCSSSTAGGIKISRMLIAGKIVKSELRRRTHDNLIDDIGFNRELISGSTLSYIYSYSTLFFATIILGTLLVSIFGGGTAETNFLTVLSCISSLGPGLDNLGLLCEYHLSSPACTFTYCFIMIAGRLEITTVLVLFSRHFWHPDRVFY